VAWLVRESVAGRECTRLKLNGLRGNGRIGHCSTLTSARHFMDGHGGYVGVVRAEDSLTTSTDLRRATSLRKQPITEGGPPEIRESTIESDEETRPNGSAFAARAPGRGFPGNAADFGGKPENTCQAKDTRLHIFGTCVRFAD